MRDTLRLQRRGLLTEALNERWKNGEEASMIGQEDITENLNREGVVPTIILVVYPMSRLLPLAGTRAKVIRATVQVRGIDIVGVPDIAKVEARPMGETIRINITDPNQDLVETTIQSLMTSRLKIIVPIVIVIEGEVQVLRTCMKGPDTPMPVKEQEVEVLPHITGNIINQTMEVRVKDHMI